MRYEYILDQCEWYGGNLGYGENAVSKKGTRVFASDQDALKWAYKECMKTQIKGPRGKPKKQYNVVLFAPGREYGPGYEVVWHIQMNYRTGKPRVYVRTEDDPYGSGYVLNPDGTHGTRRVRRQWVY